MSETTGFASDPSSQNSIQVDVLCHGVAQAFILKLPIELMQSVAKLILPKRLLALRSTCRDINAKIMQVFAQVHFTEKAFLLLHEPSMDALLAISMHPVFSKTIRKVSLHLVTLRRRHEHVQKPQSTFGLAEVRDIGFGPVVLTEARSKLTKVWPPDGASREDRRLRRQFWQEYGLILTKQQNWGRRSLWLPLLVQTLKRLGDNKYGVELEFTTAIPGPTQLPRTPRATGMLALERKFGHEDIFYADSWFFKPDRSGSIEHGLFTDIFDAGSSLVSLSITEKTIGLATTSRAATTSIAANAFEQLQTVSIDLGFTKLMPRPLAAQLFALLGCSSTIEHIKLLGDKFVWGRDKHDEILDAINMPALRHGSFIRFKVKLAAVLRFAQRHQSTLNFLEICTFHDVAFAELLQARAQLKEVIDDEEVFLRLFPYDLVLM